MNEVPPNWFAWVTNICSVAGLLITIALAVQAGNAKKKYQRLIRLSRYYDQMSKDLAELDQLIANYASSRAGIDIWSGTVIAHLQAVAMDCKGNHHQFVDNVLGWVTSLQDHTSQEELRKILRGLARIKELMVQMAEKAKIDA